MGELGFRRSGNLFVTERQGGAEGFVGFNTARRGYSPDSASLVPAIGVRFEAVADLLGRAGFANSPHTPTIVTQLEALRPPSDYEDLVVSLGSESSYEHVVDLVRRFGMPFIETHRTLEKGLEASRRGLGHYTHFTTPVFEYLLGNRTLAIHELESLGQRESGKPGAWSEHVRSVASALILVMSRDDDE